mgnify:CR=1 FL=1
MKQKKLTRWDLQTKKQAGEKIVWITAYDYWTATFAQAAGMDMILVGDSLGMCVYGYEGTVPVTMDQCIVHSEAVRRGAHDTFVIGDMPFLSYQVSIPEAVRNALDAYEAEPSKASYRSYMAAAEPRRQELIRRLNSVPGATRALVEMRADLLRLGRGALLRRVHPGAGGDHHGGVKTV